MDHDDFKEEPRSDSGLWSKMINFHVWMKALELDGLSRKRHYYGVIFYRFMVLLIHGTYKVALTRRASSLTFTTILAIFPLLAVATSTASLFLNQEREEQILSFIEDRFLPSATMSFAAVEDAADFSEEVEEAGGDIGAHVGIPLIYPMGPPAPSSPQDMMRVYLQDQKKWAGEVRGWLRTASNKFRSSAAGAGVFGFLGLLITTGLLYYTIENTVNEVWHTEHMMNWLHTIRNFTVALVFAPIIMVISISSTAIIRTLFISPTDDPDTMMEKVRLITQHFWFILYFIPLTLVAVILGMAYTYIPLAKVKFRYALLGGVVASILWEVARNVFYFYITMSTVNSTLQDAFGLSIVFLIWLYVSWLILLLGHQVVYIAQNFELLWAERATNEQTLIDGRVILAVVVILARRFMGAGGGLTNEQIRRALGLNQKDLNRTLRRLCDCGYVTEIRDNAWQIAHPPDQVTVRELLGLGLNLVSLPVARESSGLTGEIFRDIQERTLQMHEEETLADLINRVRRERAGQASAPAKEEAEVEEPAATRG